MFLHVCLAALFIYFIFFDVDFRNSLYGYGGLLIVNGGWWVRNLVHAIPLGVLTLSMWVITMLFRKDYLHDSGAAILFYLIVGIFIAFTIGISWGSFSGGFWGTIFSTDLFMLVTNFLVTIPGFILWCMFEFDEKK